MMRADLMNARKAMQKARATLAWHTPRPEDRRNALAALDAALALPDSTDAQAVADYLKNLRMEHRRNLGDVLARYRNTDAYDAMRQARDVLQGALRGEGWFVERATPVVALLDVFLADGPAPPASITFWLGEAGDAG